MPHNNNVAAKNSGFSGFPRYMALKDITEELNLAVSDYSLNLLSNTHGKMLQSRAKILSADELEMIAELTERLIPAFGGISSFATPPQDFIDHLLATCVSLNDQHCFRQGIKKIDLVAEENFHKTFLACTHKQQNQLMQALEQSTLGFSREDFRFLTLFLSLNVLGAYLSGAFTAEELRAIAPLKTLTAPKKLNITEGTTMPMYA